jgi:LCP family protein required for cell wall assembly
MLSIPRDLWVPIPGYQEDRINQAYFIGDWKKYPGGGPALAKKTIQYNFGMPIHYFITINFVGFRQLIDTLGGITVDVPKDISDPTFPDDTYGYKPLFIAKGVHHFNGVEALEYARTRHGDSDFGRMQRQQQVLKAVRDQALSLNILPKIPALWAQREGLVQTDLALDKIVALAQLAKDIKSENIQSAVIDQSMALGITTPSGAMVLWPDRERIRAVIEQLMKTPEGAVVALPTAPPQQAPPTIPPQIVEQQRKLAAEGARVELLNGTGNEPLTQRAAAWLKAQGFNVVLADKAERQDYTQSVIIESRNKPYTKALLMKLFNVSGNVRQNPNAKSDVDIRIVIGADFNEKQIPEEK